MNRFTAPAAPNAGFCRSARSRQGFARSARRYAALTRPARFARKASIGAAGILERKETQPMLDRSRHTQHHGDDRPPHAPVLRVHHDGAGGTRFAGNDHAARRHSAGTVRLRGGPFHASTQPAADTPRGSCSWTAMELAWQRAKYRGQRPSAARGGSRARRPQHAAALALAAACRPPV